MIPEYRFYELSYQELLKEAHKRRQSPTYAEKRLWKRFRGKRMLGLNFYFQHVKRNFIFDFCCPSLKVVIEIDYSVDQSLYDYYKDRDQRLTARGYHVLRFKNDEVMQYSTEVMSEIKSTLLEIKKSRKDKLLKERKKPSNIQKDPIPGPSPREGKGARIAGGIGSELQVPRNIKDLIITQARYMRQHPTRAEALLWGCLRMKRLDGYKFRRQHIIGTYIVDFYCPLCKLIVEVDGPIHQKQQVYDLSREINLIGMGYQILRFTNDDVIFHRDDVLKKILDHLQ